jgi:hypothetical protein
MQRYKDKDGRRWRRADMPCAEMGSSSSSR